MDTAGPITRAWGPSGPIRSGERVTVRYEVDDRADEIYCVMILRSVATGKVVHREDLGWQWGTVFSADPWDQYPYRMTHRWRCELPAGEYNVLIAGGTHNGAGNRWVSATCERPLVVDERARVVPD